MAAAAARDPVVVGTAAMDAWESEDRTHYDACRDLGVLAEFCPPDAELKSKKGKPAQRQLKRERRAHNDELIKKARLEAAQAAVPDGVGGSNLQVRAPRCRPAHDPPAAQHALRAPPEATARPLATRERSLPACATRGARPHAAARAAPSTPPASPRPAPSITLGWPPRGGGCILRSDRPLPASAAARGPGAAAARPALGRRSCPWPVYSLVLAPAREQRRPAARRAVCARGVRARGGVRMTEESATQVESKSAHAEKHGARKKVSARVRAPGSASRGALGWQAPASQTATSPRRPE